MQENKVLMKSHGNMCSGEGKINICVYGSKYQEHHDDIFYSMYYAKEAERGFHAEENHAVPGTFEVDIKPNEDKEITFLCSLSGEYGNL